MTRSRRTTPVEVIDFIRQQTVLGHGPTAILRQIEAGPLSAPSLRTVQSIAAEMRPPDDSDAWSPATADAGEAALVMPVLAALVRAGQMTSMTQAMARWVARVRLVAPSLGHLEVLLFAGRYLAAEGAGRGYGEVDVELARKLAERPSE